MTVTPGARADAFPRYRRPARTVLQLGLEPLVESWDSSSHPAQQRLTEYVDAVRAICRPTIEAIRDPLAVLLVVGRERVRAGDLDNFLTPVARALPSERVVSMHAIRDPASPSAIAIAAAAPDEAPPAPASDFVTARTSASATTSAWKQQVASQVGVHPASHSSAPLGLEITFRVSAQRNWVTLWKPAIDALGGILGLVGDRPWHPRDERIVSLALHRQLDPAIGHAVKMGFWWWEASPGSLHQSS